MPLVLPMFGVPKLKAPRNRKAGHPGPRPKQQLYSPELLVCATSFSSYSHRKTFPLPAPSLPFPGRGGGGVARFSIAGGFNSFRLVHPSILYIIPPYAIEYTIFCTVLKLFGCVLLQPDSGSGIHLSLIGKNELWRPRPCHPCLRAHQHQEEVSVAHFAFRPPLGHPQQPRSRGTPRGSRWPRVRSYSTTKREVSLCRTYRSSRSLTSTGVYSNEEE